MQALASALDRLQLGSLNLSLNWQMREAGVLALAAALPGTRLTHLNLESCGVDDDGAKALAAVLAQSCLTRLDLSDNGLGPDGVCALAGVLRATHLMALTFRRTCFAGRAAVLVLICMCLSCRWQHVQAVARV